METFVAVLCSARSAAATVVAVVMMRMLLPIAHRLIHPHHTHHHRLLPTPTGFCHAILHTSHHIVLWMHNFDSSISLQSMHVNRMSGSGVVCDCRLDCGGCYQTHYADSLHYQLDAAVHTLTGRANRCCQSFGTQPTLWMTNAPCTMTARSSAPTPNYSTPNRRTYRAQVNRKHWTSNFDHGASQLQVEITLKKEQTTFTTLNQVWNIGSEFVGGLDTLVVPIPLYVNEVKHLVDVGELRYRRTRVTQTDLRREGVRRPPPKCLWYLHRRYQGALAEVGRRAAVSMVALLSNDSKYWQPLNATFSVIMFTIMNIHMMKQVALRSITFLTQSSSSHQGTGLAWVSIRHEGNTSHCLQLHKTQWPLWLLGEKAEG